MAYLQLSQLGIHDEDSWWQLFDLVTMQVPSRDGYTLNLMYIDIYIFSQFNPFFHI